MKILPAQNHITATGKKRKTLTRLWNNRTLFLMCTPAILFFLVFAYLPMPGLYIAFIRFNYAQGIFKSPFVGLANFKFLIMSGDLLRLTVNTVAYNLAFILVGNVVYITVAILMNELSSKLFRKVTQTLMFLPYFISAVLVGLLAYNILSYDYGLLNTVLENLGLERVKTYSNPAPWKYIIVATYIWQTTGYYTIIYFASIMNMDPQVLEAAHIDGANALQRIYYIVLPWLKPTFIILLLFSIGSILRGNFGLFYNLVGATNAMLYKSTDIIETFVFRALMNNFNFSLGSAVSLYQSVFGFMLVMLSNWLVRRVEPDYSLF